MGVACMSSSAENTRCPHPEVPGKAGPRRTHDRGACIEAGLRPAPRHEEVGERRRSPAAASDRPKVRALALWMALLCASVASAEDKGGYTLVDPVPDRLLREFNPDRPGQSHDPTTVDAGHVQLELGAFEHVFDPRGPSATTTRRYIGPNPNLRVGVTNWMDVEVSAPFTNLLRTSGSDGPSRAYGVGDTTLGTKINLLGNDGGDHLLALLPNVKVPTAGRLVGNGFAEYVLSVPYNYKIARDLVLTAEPSIGALRNSGNTHYRDSYGVILGLDQTIARKLVASIEVSAFGTSDRKEKTAYAVSPSLAYLVGRNVQLDAGANFGLNKSTPRYNPYGGISVRY